MGDRDGGGAAPPSVRRAQLEDAVAIGRLLYDFNREFDAPTPEPDALAARIRELLRGPDFEVLLAGQEPVGVAVLRFRPAIWSQGRECYLAELYVVAPRRGLGLGRALLSAAIECARAEGADSIDLGTSEDDVAARALYERFGFTNREGRPDGPVMLVYERDLVDGETPDA